MRTILHRTISSVLILSVIIFSGGFVFIPVAMAASLTTLSDIQSDQTASTVSNHDISFITPTGVSAGETITLTFDNSTSIPVGFDYVDVDFMINGLNEVLGSSALGATWGVARTSSTVITITSDAGTVGAGDTVRILLGTNASDAGTGAHQITNGSAGTTTLTIGGSMADSGSIVEPVITNSVVNITATVAATITFAISSNSIGFGTLSSSVARYATTSGGSGTDSAAHTLTVATNAGGGYTITYNGSTLNDGLAGHTIPAALVSADANGTPGTSQFTISGGLAGDGSVDSAYDYGSLNWNFVADTPTTLASATAPVASDVVSMHYLANIAGSQAAGAYSTNITYVATGNF